MSMERSDHTIIQYAPAEKWPTSLVTLDEAAASLRITAGRLSELTDAGYAPHWRIDGGAPMYRLADLRTWGARNLTACCAGRSLPVELSIRVDPLPCNTAPAAIRDIPELVELPIAGACGIYFLVKGNKVVYVGQSISPLSRIGTHGLDEHKDFDRAYIFPVPRSLLDSVEGALIRWLRPPYNIRERGLVAPRDSGTDAIVIERIFGHEILHLATVEASE